MKIYTSVGEWIGSPIDEVSYTNSEAHKKMGLVFLGGQSTFWLRLARVIFGLRSLRVLPMLTHPSVFLLREILPVYLILFISIKGFLTVFLYFEV